MSIPKHPVNERKACAFHALFALIGAVHIISGFKSKSLLKAVHIAGGTMMMWFHGEGARRHWISRNEVL